MSTQVYTKQLPILGKYRKFLIRPDHQWALIAPQDLKEGMTIRVEARGGGQEGILLGLWIASGYWCGRLKTTLGVGRVGLGKAAEGATCQPLAPVRN